MRTVNLIFSFILVLGAFLYFVATADLAPVPIEDALGALQASEDSNMSSADSAPQQTVAMLWTLRDYSIAIMQQNTQVNRLLRFIATAMALLLGFTGMSAIASYWGRQDCRYCHESIKKEATVCPFCKTEFDLGQLDRMDG